MIYDLVEVILRLNLDLKLKIAIVYFKILNGYNTLKIFIIITHLILDKF